MPAPVIYYIRHGETGWNAEGRFQGSKDIPLNDLGREQAAAAGEILGRVLAQDGHAASALPFVSSPLGRARMTMELARGALNLPVADYGIDARLREIGYGELGRPDASRKCSSTTPRPLPRASADKWTRRRARRRELCRGDGADARLVSVSDGGYGRGRPWRHRAGADGGARHRDAAKAPPTPRSSRAWSMCSATAG